MNLPKISFVTATYGRLPEYVHLLEEALECFRRQSYPPELKEMVVLNDAGPQEYLCSLPGVRIVNVGSRYASLGEKLNAAIQLATGDVIFPQDDDDISLPHRVSLSIEMLGDADYFNPKSYWYMPPDKLVHEQMTGVAHNCSCFRKAAWTAVGGYPALSGAQDQGLDAALRKACKVVDGPLTPEQTFFAYRWGVSPLHLSGRAPHDEFYADIGKIPLTSGRYVLRPHWRQDYQALIAEALNHVGGAK